MTGPSSAMTSSQKLERIHEYYCTPRVADGRKMTVYDLWEEGSAFNDSVTPSTFCPEYRSHVVLKVMTLSQPGDQIFSIGCGNGFVEASLVKGARRVVGIDCNEEAISLSRSKGVDAYRADYFDLPKATLAGFDVIYADGLLGHVYNNNSGLDIFFQKLEHLAPKPGAWLVFSNDAPRDPNDYVAPHDRLDDFWYFSRFYLVETLKKWNLHPYEDYTFPYFRPISGMRSRTICIGRVPLSASN
jgi:2-polyprenyl-3-methyl-5-hydroxy-6-metoxy-1,4-benzoquinol methylase